MKYRLSESAYKLEGQPMFKVLSKVKDMEKKGADIVHFEIGDPDFSTPPNIINAACSALHDNKTHYTSSLGLTDFREAVSKITENSRGFKPALDQILVTPGANILIYYAVKCLVNKGDEVIVPDPGFPTYYSVLKYCECVPVRVPLFEKNEFRMNPDDVRKRITDKTRMIIMNSPQNPTGSVMTPEEVEEMAKIAEEHDIYLYSDEIYVRMIFDESSVFSSPAKYDLCKERTIVANGFSKAFAMTGWRLGVGIGPADVIAKMGLLLETTSSCVPPFIQCAGIEAVLAEQTYIIDMMDKYKKRRDILVDGLNTLPGIKCIKPGGAFYVFPNITGTGLNSGEFTDLMLDKANVALLPGTNFGEYGEGYVRLCYSISEKEIEEGLNRIRKVLD